MSVRKVILDFKMMWGYSRGLLRGIVRYSNLHGPWSFYSNPGNRERMLPHLNDWNADGMIVNYEMYKRHQKDIPDHVPVLCIFDKAFHDMPAINPDSVKAGRIGAEYLLGLGFKYFAFCSFYDQWWSRDRAKGFEDRLKAEGCGVYLYKCSYARFQRSWYNESALLAEWLKTLPKPLGLMACNDIFGREIIESCKQVGLRVPYDVAVLGVDNDDMICNLSTPPLSSILFYTEAAGYEGAALLDKMMMGTVSGSPQVLVDVQEVIERQSTNVLFIEDELVSRAVQYIRRSVHKPVKVDDVADEVAISRRTLERKFREVLNSSVLDEVKRARIDMIVHLLLETNDSISQIANRLGYAGSKNISRYFKQQTGFTPQEYRKKYRFQLKPLTKK